MKIKVKMIKESKEMTGFTNSTEDQFPYVEAAINSLDSNFNWWKENWESLEQMIVQNLNKSLSDNMENSNVSISSRFTVFHGTDEKASDVIWTGPAIVYTFNGASSNVVKGIKNAFKGMFKGHKIFSDGNKLIVLFG